MNACIALAPLAAAQESDNVELPELGDTTSGIVSISEERRLGKELLRQVRRQVPTVNDPILKYFAEVSLYRITEFANLPDAGLFPVLIDSSELNAFAAPGGVIGINLGLMLHAEDVHEYASVIGHELAQVGQLMADDARTPPAYLLSHPLSEERIADTKQQATRYPQLEYSNSRSYQMMRARTLVRYAESPQAAVDYWQRKVEEGSQPHISRYGLAYALAMNDKAAHGLDTLRPMQTAFDDSLLFAASQAELMIKAGQLDQALSFLTRQLILNPDNAPLSMLKAQALTADERYAEATEVLKRQSVLHPEDYDVWFELAETAGLADDTMQVHMARAEFFALTGDFEGSLKQLEFAAKLANPAQFELLAGLSQRIRDLRGAIAASR